MVIKNRFFYIFTAALLVISLCFAACAIKNESTHSRPRLSNPNSNDLTCKIYSYLCSLSGSGVLTAQQESTWMDSPDYEMNYIYNASGKYPAMRGLDYMNDDFDGVNRRAAEWFGKGGLVTICWHTGSDFNGEWKDAMNDEVTDWDALFTEGTPENKKLLDGMDKGAKALSELQKNGVTVIWRPFHEFDGGWFWWGKGGADNFVKLWRLMYERYTEYWHLNNLIWVLGYSHNGKDYTKWYPGDEYCDIIGADSYDGGAQPKSIKRKNRYAFMNAGRIPPNRNCVKRRGYGL